MTISQNAIRLVVQGMNDVPSLKNNKRAILDRNTGKMRTLTEPETKRWMEQCIQSFVSQLECVTRTLAAETLTGEQPRSLIASSMPQDDSWAWIPEIHIYADSVPKGFEGAEIIIERL